MAGPTVTASLHPTRSGQLRASNQRPGGGVVTFCSWQRLADELRRAGCIASNEVVESFAIQDDGISIHLRTR